MTSTIYTITVDCEDPDRLGAFWGEVLGWGRTYETAEDVQIEGSEDVPGILFQRVPEAKEVKNRIHLDLTPDDQAAEVARVKALGATEVDIGQGQQSWVVLADPEGNEFCILDPNDD